MCLSAGDKAEAVAEPKTIARIIDLRAAEQEYVI
jgi:hypothetical protein